jgi:hypothetical protein
MPGLWTGLADAANRCMHRRYDDDGTVETTAAADAEFYRLLGISSGAAPKQVTKGYRTMAAKWHPDKCVPVPRRIPARVFRWWLVWGRGGRRVCG